MNTAFQNRESDVSLPLRELPQARTTSPTPTFSKSLRRKRSFSFQSTSSEDYSSPHDSIYEAVYISPIGSEENGHNKIHIINIPPRKKSTSLDNGSGNNENKKETLAVFDKPKPTLDDAEFLYGHGTPLETITEQKSYGTMRSLTQSKSKDELPSSPFINHRDSFMLAKIPRRKQSFSLDDIALINRTYHEACTMIERETQKSLHIHEIYAQPKAPIHAPPKCPNTPPGMPSWTEAQARPKLQIIPHQNRVQRWLGLPPSDIVYSSRMSNSSLCRTMSFPGPIAPRFRAPRSAYGPLDQHPFVKARTSQIAESSRPAAACNGEESPRNSQETKPSNSRLKIRLERRVRFTSSAIGRDSEMLRTAVDPTSSNLLPFTNSMQAVPYHENPSKQTKCPHWKGRRAALKALNHNQVQLSAISFAPNTDALLAPNSSPQPSISTNSSPNLSPTHPPSSVSRRMPLNERDVSVIDLQPTRTLSGSSTAQLMPGSLDSNLIPSNLKEKSEMCWKCRVENVFGKIDRLWARSASCLCFVCCGFDMEDGSTRPHRYARGGSGFSPNAARMRGGWFEQDLAPRVVYLEQTPPGMV